MLSLKITSSNGRTTTASRSMDDLRAKLAVFQGPQWKQVLQQSLNDTAGLARVASLDEMKAAFQSPTPYIVPSEYKAFEGSRRGSIFVDTKYRCTDKSAAPTVIIGVKTSMDGGVGANKVLSAEITGGPRAQKRSEIALQQRLAQLGVKDAKYYVPGSAAKLDQYGNIPGSRIVSVLSALKAFPEVGYMANRTAASAARRAKSKRPGRPSEYGIARGNRGQGSYYIYQKKKGKRATEPLLVFLNRAPRYKKRIDPVERILDTFSTQFFKQFERVVDYRLRAFR